MPAPSTPATAPRPLKVVAIGGGTGLSSLLRGFKQYVKTFDHRPPADAPAIAQLTAVVTVTDDGGSSGRLRKEFNILPPGDIRNCMVALAEDEASLSRLFQYRFPTGTGLEGHSFGNLFLTALTAVKGDFAEAVRESSQIVASRGHIFPSTTSNVQLDATMEDGSRVCGETRISASPLRIRQLRLVPANARPLPETLRAIEEADLITIGPGSLFTSLIPNVLVRGIPEAIVRSKAVKVYVANLMTQTNESIGLTAADHVKAIRAHARMRIFDYAVVNTATIPPIMLARYALEGATQIVVDRDNIAALGLGLLEGDYIHIDSVVRHAAERVAKDVLNLAAFVHTGRELAAKP